MSRFTSIPAETRRAQTDAADPAASVWVSANAGAGKTHVLAERVMRLLLDGTDPSRILCLTYTRAAAANMANRVFGNLSQWAILEDEALAARIAELEGAIPDARRLRRARRLFAEALETPGGLKIQTIHAFCEAVLHQFPLEANIAAHFELLDPAMEAALFADARREMITGAVTGDNPELAEAFATILQLVGESGLDDLLSEIVRKRDELRRFIAGFGNDGGRFAALFEACGVPPEGTALGAAATAWPLPGFDDELVDRLELTALALGAGRAGDFCAKIRAALASPDTVVRLDGLAGAFLKSSGAEKGRPQSAGYLFTKAVLGTVPHLAERFEQAAEALVALVDRVALLRMLEATRAALVAADWMIGRYEQLKSGRGFLDFNDLITRTVALLARPDAGPWVQYKLDKGIDHILLDEAQDTSPVQWDVVMRLAGEFFAGYGARGEAVRTVFAVGDEKQSIYSFQGAAPHAFAESAMRVGTMVRDAEATFEDVTLSWSFRSTGDVLDAVDRVFADPDAARGVSRGGLPTSHRPIRAGDPGYVEVWPMLGDVTVDDEPEDWRKPVDHASAASVRVAQRVADTIAIWLSTGERLEAADRPVTAGDIMVLVRKRDGFVHALSRALKTAGVPVSGADRLSLTGHLAVQDLMALGRHLLQPQDDLSLAALLRSPIFDLSEQALFDLAHDRGRRSLREALAAAAPSDPALASIAEQLDLWSSEAAFGTVFAFYARILARDGVRAKLVGRLGPEAGDLLDEFLTFCLAQEKTGLPGLEAFLATLESASPEIKREMDQTRAEVRIMTVHAAKGLEAPVVFLVDGGAAPFHASHLPRLLPVALNLQGQPGPGFLWRTDASTANSLSKAAEADIRELQQNEYRRLLYVGMTRAEDRLIVCGYYGKKQPGPDTWHAMVTRALEGAPGSGMVPHPAVASEQVLRFRVTPLRTLSGGHSLPPPAPPNFAPLPELLRLPLEGEDELPPPLSPSGAAAEVAELVEAVASASSPVLDSGRSPSFAQARGQALHRLLQHLPGLPEAGRAEAATRYIARVGAEWPEAERTHAVESALAVLSDTAFAPVFAHGSRAEVALSGTIVVNGAPRPISAVADRIALDTTRVLVVDYKTNRPAPGDFTEVPPAYVLQLALYRALLSPLFPGLRVEAALLFTEAPRLVMLPPDLMDAALARLGVA